MCKNDELKCNICGGKADAVTGSILGPYSEATCSECRKYNRVNYNELVIVFACNGVRDIDDVNSANKEVMKATLEFFNKTEEDLLRDIKEEIKRQDEYESGVMNG